MSWSDWWGGNKDKDTEEEQEQNEGSGWTKGLEVASGLMQSVSSYATTIGDNVKKQVTETTSSGFLGEFQKEQEKFEKRQRHNQDAGVPPWVGFNEEEQMKAQIMELSADSRNVLREPPHGVDFPFDYTSVSPVAMVMLKEDLRLQKLRFELVPKKVKEEVFWRNYFYRVSLIKQSVQLSTLSSVESPKTDVETRIQPKAIDNKEEERPTEQVQAIEGDESVHGEEFASDLYNSNVVSKDAIKNELNQLGVSKEDDNEEDEIIVDEEELWDELQAELQELDLGDEAQGNDINEEWEQEIQDMLQDGNEDKTD